MIGPTTAPTKPDRATSFQSDGASLTRRRLGESATAGMSWMRKAITNGWTSFTTSFDRLGQTPKRTAARTTARYPRVRSGIFTNHREGNGTYFLEILGTQGLR